MPTKVKWALAITVAAVLLGGVLPKLHADPIPLHEGFLATQVLYVLGSWSAETQILAQVFGFVDPNAVMQYDGTFTVFTTHGADPLGVFSGALTGNYGGSPIEVDFDGVLQTTGSTTTKVNSTFTEKGKNKGSDKGTITVEDDGTATVDIDITIYSTGSKVTGTGLKYEKDVKANKLTVTGKVTSNGKPATFKFVLDQKTNDFESGIFYTPALEGVKSKDGGYLELHTDPTETIYGLKFTVVPTPEPIELIPGVLCALGLYLRGRWLRPRSRAGR